MVSWETKAQREQAGCGLPRHDKQGWQVLVTDKVPGLYSEDSWHEGLLEHSRGGSKVDKGAGVMLGQDVESW